MRLIYTFFLSITILLINSICNAQFFVPVYVHDFNGDTLDEYHWTYINRAHQRLTGLEYQYYTDDGSNHIFDNGILKLRGNDNNVWANVLDFKINKSK